MKSLQKFRRDIAISNHIFFLLERFQINKITQHLSILKFKSLLHNLRVLFDKLIFLRRTMSDAMVVDFQIRRWTATPIFYLVDLMMRVMDVKVFVDHFFKWMESALRVLVFVVATAYLILWEFLLGLFQSSLLSIF